MFQIKMSDVLDLYPGDNETHFLFEHLRPIWTPGGMVCHVTECPRKDIIPSLRAFIRHWQSIHVPTITLFVCGHLDCMESVKVTTRNELVRHIMKKHHLTQTDAKRLAMNSPTRLESNCHYVNPRESLPPKRLSPSAEMARQSDRLRRFQQIGVVPDLEGKGDNPIHGVCRDEYVTFNPDTCEPTGKKFKRRRRTKATATATTSSSITIVSSTKQ